MDLILHRRDLDGTLAQFFQNQNPKTNKKIHREHQIPTPQKQPNTIQKEINRE